MDLQSHLDKRTRESELVEKLSGNKVRCLACGHRCLIFEEKRGICSVRFNRKGELMVPYGYVSSIQCDPTEKKPFYHLLPGSRSLTFGMLGCNFHCPYCQNWEISQAIRDSEAGTEPTELSPEEIVQLAKQSGASVVASSYNEPLITAEWSVAIFKIAKKNGLKTAFVSNGYGTPEVLNFIRPYTDCCKVDLKGMKQENYRELGGKVSEVLKTISQLVEMKFWVEVVTLIVPGFNDSDEEIKELAKFLVSISSDIPWHVTAFHEDYKMLGAKNTAASDLVRAAHIGEEVGLKFVYAGNLPGQSGHYENTYCPSCKTLLVKRHGFVVSENHLQNTGKCHTCQTNISGIWS